MSIVKSIDVGDGDMFYIKHNNGCFTTIDCCMNYDNKEYIMDEIEKESRESSITRFISTHPDDDHFRNIEYYNKRKEIINFYCVKNNVRKEKETDSFSYYRKLRDSDKCKYVHSGLERKWLNQGNDERRGSGLYFLWPKMGNRYFDEELSKANETGSPNNISLILQYNCSIKFLWMGDMETDFLQKIKGDVNFEQVDVLFAPHHGRKSGKIPKDIMEKLDPQIVVIGSADSEYLDYYYGYNTITQNSAGDVTFECGCGYVNVYVGNKNYSVDFLLDCSQNTYENYIGSFSKRK